MNRLTEKQIEQQKKEMSASVSLLMDAVLNLLQYDNHHWGESPCPTCRPITTIIGKPFGCYQYAIERKEAKKRQENKSA